MFKGCCCSELVLIFDIPYVRKNYEVSTEPLDCALKRNCIPNENVARRDTDEYSFRSLGDPPLSTGPKSLIGRSVKKADRFNFDKSMHRCLQDGWTRRAISAHLWGHSEQCTKFHIPSYMNYAPIIEY